MERLGAAPPPAPVRSKPAPRPVSPVRDMPSEPGHGTPPVSGGGISGPAKLPPLTLPGAVSAPSPVRTGGNHFKDPRMRGGSQQQDPRLAHPASTIPAEIARRAQMYGVPLGVALAVGKVESGYRQGAISPAGAIGVMQLMPGTAAELGVDPYNWRQNIDGGVRYLAAKIKQYHGNVQEALQAYNGGDGNVGSAETKHYAATVLATRDELRKGGVLPPGDKGFYVITSPLPVMNIVTPHGPRMDSSTGLGDFHYGIDLAAPEGTAVHAMIGGKVIARGVDPTGAQGYYVAIKDQAGREWFYMHLAEKAPVLIGAKVQAGDRIGAVGMTGLTTGPHMHLGLKAPMLSIGEKERGGIVSYSKKPYMTFAYGKSPANSSLVSGPLRYAGPDQGIDFTGPGYVHALGHGVVTRAVSGGSGWDGQGGLIVYRITDGPGKGRYVYNAEDIEPTVRAGDRIIPGEVIGRATGSGQAPGIEIGWARNAHGSAYGTTSDGKPGGPEPVYGKNFQAFVQRLHITRTGESYQWVNPTDIVGKAAKVGWNNTRRVYAPLVVPGGVQSANAPYPGAAGAGGSASGGSGADMRFGQDVTPFAESPIDTNDVASDPLGTQQSPTNVFEQLAASGPISPETAALMSQTVGQQQTLPPEIAAGGPDQFIPPPPTG